MSSAKRYLILAALMVCLLMGTSFLVIPFIGIFISLAAVVAFVVLAVYSVKSASPRFKDPYDLRLLREVHEKREMEKVDENEIPEGADVVCPHCGHLYGSKFRICPNCKRMP